MRNPSKLLLVLVIPLMLAACASSANPDYIPRDAAQELSTVENGIIISIRHVTVDGSQSGVGAIAGGAIGALGGLSASRSRPESQILGILGAVGGAVAGNAIEKASTKEKATELTVRLDNGQTRAVVQGIGEQQFMPGDHVQIISQGRKVRVVRVATPILPENYHRH